MSARLARFIARRVQRWELPAALVLIAGALVTFVGVLVHLIDVGEFRVATLLIAADLGVSGCSALQESTSEAEQPVAIPHVTVIFNREGTVEGVEVLDSGASIPQDEAVDP